MHKLRSQTARRLSASVKCAPMTRPDEVNQRLTACPLKLDSARHSAGGGLPVLILTVLTAAQPFCSASRFDSCQTAT